jgi:hypothetical protein
MIFKIFSPKNSAKKLAFSIQNKAKLGKKFIITLVCEKNALFAENCRKSQKIVIVTSVPGQCDRTFCEKIAQNGALLNRIFTQRNYWSKFVNFETKGSKNLGLI